LTLSQVVLALFRGEIGELMKENLNVAMQAAILRLKANREQACLFFLRLCVDLQMPFIYGLFTIQN
jgi:hypothetical protein